MITLKKTLVAAAVALCTNHLSAVESYDVIDLGTLDDKAVTVFDVNNSDTSVGYNYNVVTLTNGQQIEDPIHGFAYQSGTLTDLGSVTNDPIDDNTPAADKSVMFGVNNNGLAVGYSHQTNDDDITAERAVYTNIGSDTFGIVPPFNTDEFATMRALSVNDNSLVVGFASTNVEGDVDLNGEPEESRVARGFVYDSVNDTLTMISPPNYQGTVSTSVVRDISNTGLITGWAEVPFEGDFYERSFYADMSDPDNVIEIPLTIDERGSYSWAINDAGIVVGKRDISEETNVNFKLFHGYIYDTVNQTITDIPELNPGYIPDRNQSFEDVSVAFDINNSNQVVGKGLIEVVPHTYHATIFENGVLTDLNTLIDCKVDPNEEAVGSPDWVLSEARAINDNGVIVGNGVLNGQRKAFMLVPRPGVEPRVCQLVEDSGSGSGSMPLWALSVFGLILFRPKKS